MHTTQQDVDRYEGGAVLRRGVDFGEQLSAGGDLAPSEGRGGTGGEVGSARQVEAGAADGHVLVRPPNHLNLGHTHTPAGERGRHSQLFLTQHVILLPTNTRLLTIE